MLEKILNKTQKKIMYKYAPGNELVGSVLEAYKDEILLEILQADINFLLDLNSEISILVSRSFLKEGKV